MHTTTVTRPGEPEYRAAVSLAVRAPSLHNTQPWRWSLTGDGLELRADRTRQLTATDPDGHGLLLGCGAALHLARLGLLAQGWESDVDRLPDPADPDLLALIHPAGGGWVTDETLHLTRAAFHRHSERRPFHPHPVPTFLLDDLRRAALGDGVYLHPVRRHDERYDLATAVSWADRHEQEDLAVRAELAAWVRTDDSHADGVPVAAVPHLSKDQVRRMDIPVRDFEQAGARGRQWVSGRVAEQPAVAVLFTTADDRGAWLRAGEGLGRVLVQAAGLGLATSLVSQPVDLPAVRARFRTLMSWNDHPRMVVRVGWPPAGSPGPLTRRRGVGDVVTRRTAARRLP